MDYRKFLNRTQTRVLPYTGGLGVHVPDRRLRLRGPALVPGWWRFELSGREAIPDSPVDEPDERAMTELEACKRVRGHLVGRWLFRSATQVERVRFLPADSRDHGASEADSSGEELELFTPVSTRRWHGGKLLYTGVEFEDEPELAAREALYEGLALTAKGVTPSLRGAFAWARMARWARDEGVHVSPREVLRTMHPLVDHSRTPEEVFLELHARNLELNPGREQARWRRRVPPPPREHVFREPPTRDNAERRAALVLDAAGADLSRARFSGERNLELHFDFRDQRFIALVDWETLHVYDSGICLSGHDEDLGLDCLPAVIQEAIDTGVLYITRYG